MFWKKAQKKKSDEQKPIDPTIATFIDPNTNFYDPNQRPFQPITINQPLHVYADERARQRRSRRRRDDRRSTDSIDEELQIKAEQPAENTSTSTPNKFNVSRFIFPVWYILQIVFSVVAYGILLDWKPDLISAVVPVDVSSTGAILCLAAQILLTLTSAWLVTTCHRNFKLFDKIRVDKKNEIESQKEDGTTFKYSAFPMLSRWYILLWLGSGIAGGVIGGLLNSTGGKSISSAMLLAIPVVLVITWLLEGLFAATKFFQNKRISQIKIVDEEKGDEEDSAKKTVSRKSRQLEGTDINVQPDYTVSFNPGPELGSDTDEDIPNTRSSRERSKKSKRSKKTKSRQKRRSRRHYSDSFSSESETESDDSFASTIVPQRRARKVQPYVYEQGLARPPAARTRDRNSRRI